MTTCIYKYAALRETILISFFGSLSLVMLSFQLSGQIVIVADTLSSDCVNYYPLHKLKEKQYVVHSQEEYEQSEVFKITNGACLPFEAIDFEKNVLVGFKYNGSACDMEVVRSEVTLRDNDYVIKFSTKPNVCRDLRRRIAWFLLTRPSEKFNVVVEKTWTWDQ